MVHYFKDFIVKIRNLEKLALRGMILQGFPSRKDPRHLSLAQGELGVFSTKRVRHLKNQQKFAPLKIQHIIELVTDHTVFSFGFIFK